MENDNEIKDEALNQETDTTADLINAMEQLKKNSVSKEDYNKLRKENKMLLDNIVNNVPQAEEVKVDEPVDIQKLRNDLFGSENQDITNLDYITKVMKLRNALLEKGERDPFLPFGKNILPTDDDIKTANRVAEVYQSCIDVADGDPDIFTQELQRVTIDVVPTKRR